MRANLADRDQKLADLIQKFMPRDQYTGHEEEGRLLPYIDHHKEETAQQRRLSRCACAPSCAPNPIPFLVHVVDLHCHRANHCP